MRTPRGKTSSLGGLDPGGGTHVLGVKEVGEVEDLGLDGVAGLVHGCGGRRAGGGGCGALDSPALGEDVAVHGDAKHGEHGGRRGELSDAHGCVGWSV